LPDPELIDFDGDFRVNMYRNTAIDYSPRVNDRVNDKVNDRVNEIEEKILKFIDNDPAITITQLSMELELSRKTIAAKLKTLKEKK
jgi:ATP-dependent DNA helicase RecG